MKPFAPPLFAVSFVWLGCCVARAAAPGQMTAEDLKQLPGLNRMIWLRVPPAREVPTVDGKLDLGAGEWADAVCVAGMMGWRAQGGQLIPIPARSYLTWDKKNFYLGVRTGILPGGRLQRSQRRDEGQIHRDDAIEIFFDPLMRDQAERAHYQVILNSLDKRMDLMITAGVNAKFWNGDWTIKSDYRRGMDHWDAEIVVPVESMFIRSDNAPGHVWRFLVCRDWIRLLDTDTNQKYWRIYSSLTGWGAFPYPESYGALVLDDRAPVVQLLDLKDLYQGKFGLTARLANHTDRPIACLATARAFSQYAEGDRKGTTVDWLARDDPIHEAKRQITLKPGEETTWTIPPKALPPLGNGKDAPQWYDMVLGVTSPNGKTTYFRAQRHFRKLHYEAYVQPYELPLSVTYNPVRDNLRLWCDVMDDPSRERVASVKVELFGRGKAGGEPLLTATATDRQLELYEAVIDVPRLKIGEYPVRATLIDDAGKALATKDLVIEKLDERKEFKWWQCGAGKSGRPIPPHRDMQYRGNTVTTTMGEYTFGGSGMPSQIRMTGEDLLAAPVRLTAGVAGKPVSFGFPAAPKIVRQSAGEAGFSGELTSQPLAVRVASRMEYDGCTEITLDVQPQDEPTVDYLRLEMPLRPERAQFLWSMAQDCRASWLAEDLRTGEGVVWDSSNREGFQMTVGTFIPQYVVSDSLRGLCWFADNDRGWVPTDEVPAAEVVRVGGETILRMNLIGRPFRITRPRRIVFYLLGLPGRPLPEGWRIYHRGASNFGDYVGDPVLNYSAPMPKDFAKAQDFIANGTLYNKDGTPSGRRSAKCHPNVDFAPWHDTHNWFRTPEINPKTFDYFKLECGDGAFTLTMIDYKCYLWSEYVRRTDIDGVYFDTPEQMGFSFNLSNGVAYRIPDDQPGAGQIQPGYSISGFREYVKRVRAIFTAGGRDRPWIEMHATHGPVAPCTPFLDVRTDGEHHRTPSSGHFMRAWSRAHLRAIDVPPMFGIVTRWLGGYPWDNRILGVDPLRTKIGALLLHDVFTGWGDFERTTRLYRPEYESNRGPGFGFKQHRVTERLIAHGLNRAEVVYYPYWDNKPWVKVVDRRGKPIDGIIASLWHVPSQQKAVVVAASYNERTVKGAHLEVDLKRLGLTPTGRGEQLLVLDAETGEATTSGPAPDHTVLDLPPLDFALVLFARVGMGAKPPVAEVPILPTERPRIEPLPSADAVRNELAAHGLLAPDVRRYGAEKLAEVLSFEAPEGAEVKVEAFHAPAQDKVLVVLANTGQRRFDVRAIALNLKKLDMMPQEPGENLVVLNPRTTELLQETTHRNRGRLHVRGGVRNREIGKIDTLRLEPGDVELILFAKQ